MILLICVITTAYAKITELTDVNLAKYLGTHLEAFVLFHSPKCALCRSAESQFDKVAGDMEDLAFGTVNVLSEVHISTAFDIVGVPTFYYFRNLSYTEYNGPLDDMTKWLKTQRSSHVTHLNSYPAVQQFLSKNPIAFAMFADEFSVEHKLFEKATQSLTKKIFGLSTKKQTTEHYEVPFPSLVVFKHSDNKQRVLDTLTEGKITEFIEEEKYPWVMSLDDTAYEYFFTLEKPGLFIFSNVTGVADGIASSQLKICVANLGEHPKFAELLGVTVAMQPTSFIIESSKNILKKYQLEKELTEANLKELIEKWKSGEAKRWLKSQPLPSDEEDHVVQANFEEMVLDKEKAVLVHFYAPWCGLCKTLEDTLKEVRKTLGETIIVTRFDAMANDFEAEDIHEFPLLKFYPKGTKGGLSYRSKSYSHDNIVQFVQSISKAKNASMKKDDL